MKKKLVAIVALCLAVCLAGTVSAKKINKDFHKSYDVDVGAILHLRHGDGDVTITPWNKDVVDIKVKYRADSKVVGLGGRHTFDVEFRQNGNEIFVIAKEMSYNVIGFTSLREYEYTYTIQAPSYVDLDLEGDDGDVKLERWEGFVECRLDDGDVEFAYINSDETRIEMNDGNVRVDELHGDLFVEAEDGDITILNCETGLCRVRLDDGDLTIRHCRGSFDIGLEDGDVDFQRVRADKLELRMDDGDADVDLLKVDELDVDITAADGDVVVDLEPGISATFLIDTDDGGVRVNVPGATDLDKRKHRVSGQMLDGRGRIRIRTDDGSVVLRESR
jgi:DUF4097 and DUF4098 domain-containing protein YvlB